MTQTSRFIEEVVPVAQSVTGDGGESAAPNGGGGFADYVLVSLQWLRIYLDTSYRMTIDLLKEMPQIIGEIGLVEADLPAPSTLCKAFDRIDMEVCRVLLRQSAQLHDLLGHWAVDATFYERSAASRHYCNRTDYRIQKLKVTKLVDTESKLLLDIDVHSRGTDPTAAFLHRLPEKHDIDDTEFLVDTGGYLTALAGQELSGPFNYSDRNHIEKRFQTVSMRIDRLHSFWRGSQSSARRQLQRFKYHYNHDRPNQALDGRTPAEEVLN